MRLARHEKFLLERYLSTTSYSRAAPILTLEDYARSQDLEDILDSFDGLPSRAEISVTNSKTLSPAVRSEITEEDGALSDIQLRRRRDLSNSRLDKIGSCVQIAYSPRNLLNTPPDIADTGITALVAAQAHLGHSTALWNPATQPFIYGIRNGIHIFNLDLTLSHLRRAAEVVRGVAANDGNILFVGTRPGQKRAVVEAARRAGGFHVFERWIPGTITNGKQVVGHGKVKEMVTKHQRNSNPARNTTSLPNSISPDLVVVLNPLENRNLLKECARGRVPTIGIIDSDVDPRLVTYTIPANDDSIRCTSLIVGILSRAAEAGRVQMKIPDWEQTEVVL